MIKEFNFYYVLVTILVNIHGFFFRNTKKVLQLLIHFTKILNQSEGDKPNKKWVDKGSEFYNRSMKSWLIDNNTEIY